MLISRLICLLGPSLHYTISVPFDGIEVLFYRSSLYEALAMSSIMFSKSVGLIADPKLQRDVDANSILLLAIYRTFASIKPLLYILSRSLVVS